VDQYPSLVELAAAPAEELEEIHGMGPNTAANLKQWFAAARNQRLLTKLEQAGVRVIQARAPEPGSVATTPTPFEDKVFVITGTLPTMTRDEARALIVKRGGKVTGSVSGRTDYLVCGEKAGSKLTKAQQLGVPVLDEAALLQMAGEDG
jgi:DNA ligase (NAD+)